MLKKTVKLLRGSVRVRAQSVYPERVLNLCSARGIEFWDLKWLSASELSFCLSRRDLRALRRAAEGIEAELSRALSPPLRAACRRGAVLCAAAREFTFYLGL